MYEYGNLIMQWIKLIELLDKLYVSVKCLKIIKRDKLMNESHCEMAPLVFVGVRG